tara:strand:- start:1989 stop:2546 length:558 start_codon:yes stop_codon:yes gene_type:complete
MNYQLIAEMIQSNTLYWIVETGEDNLYLVGTLDLKMINGVHYENPLLFSDVHNQRYKDINSTLSLTKDYFPFQQLSIGSFKKGFPLPYPTFLSATTASKLLFSFLAEVKGPNLKFYSINLLWLKYLNDNLPEHIGSIDNKAVFESFDKNDFYLKQLEGDYVLYHKDHKDLLFYEIYGVMKKVHNK